MPKASISNFCILPDLEFVKFYGVGSYFYLEVKKNTLYEVCPKCATISYKIYDHRRVFIKDSPLRHKNVKLVINKRRFYCKHCSCVFTEPVSGISKGARSTERFKKALLWACENFADLKSVKKYLDCSYGFIYKILYEQLERQRKRHLNYPWPRTIGIDEHSFKKNKETGRKEFVSFIIDHRNKKAFEVVKGRSIEDLRESLSHIAHRENVHFVTMDLCTTYRNFVKGFFPNARIVADKFHVLRLLNPAINSRRKQITGDKRSNPIRLLLLKSGINVNSKTKAAMYQWLNTYPELREVYEYKEALQRFYRIKGYNRAEAVLTKLLDKMGTSKLDEIITLRKTLISWRKEILLYFSTRLTNARVEGFNNVAKVIKRRAYGYRSFKNYRLRVLNACS